MPGQADVDQHHLRLRVAAPREPAAPSAASLHRWPCELEQAAQRLARVVVVLDEQDAAARAVRGLQRRGAGAGAGGATPAGAP